MAELKQIFKCSSCGQITEVLHSGVGELVCCNIPMEPQKETSGPEGQEKHLPVIEKVGDKIKVSIGSIEHPMEEAHFIEWIELEADGLSTKKFLQPKDRPVAEFCFTSDNVRARAYCNIHGLWVSQG